MLLTSFKECSSPHKISAFIKLGYRLVGNFVSAILFLACTNAIVATPAVANRLQRQ